MTPTEKDALERWAAQLRTFVNYPPRIDTDAAGDRINDAIRLINSAITILEDGLPF